jgi:hypothetical protein
MRTYAEQAALYTEQTFRERAGRCIAEQGLVFAADGRQDIAGLGRAVVAGSGADCDAVLSAAVSYSGAGDLSTDQGLLAAVQAVWPAVAAARHPQAG